MQIEFISTWSGVWPPLPTDNIPKRRTSVAYALINGAGRVVYVGSTGWFLQRMSVHRRRDRAVASWRAFPCPDRAAAYVLERQLIDYYNPAWNMNGFRSSRRRDRNAASFTSPPVVNDDDVDVSGYYRQRFGRREFVRTHNRTPRSPSPGGYRITRERSDGAA